MAQEEIHQLLSEKCKVKTTNDLDVLKQKILDLNECTNELTRTELVDRIEEIATFVKEIK